MGALQLLGSLFAAVTGAFVPVRNAVYLCVCMLVCTCYFLSVKELSYAIHSVLVLCYMYMYPCVVNVLSVVHGSDYSGTLVIQTSIM